MWGFCYGLQEKVGSIAGRGWRAGFKTRCATALKMRKSPDITRLTFPVCNVDKLVPAESVRIHAMS